MSHKADLLIELGVEELPAGAVFPMQQFLADELVRLLDEAGLSPGESIQYSTPRRLAVLVKDVIAEQPDRAVQKRGPAVQAAFDQDGNPSKALQGFARSCGVEVDKLTRIKTDKGEWMGFDSVQSGESLAGVLAAALPQIVKQMPMPKRMRWADQSEEFLRPVQWLLVLHGETLLPVSVLGLNAGRTTRGHRFHAPQPLSISTAGDYEKTLKDSGYVIANVAQRRALIVQQIEQAALAAGGAVNIDPALLDEVTALVEWPVALHGQFESEFLSIPKEALIQTMEENQRYFALFDKSGDLLPGFITVANIESSNPATVREGNERVIRPRFKDTMFFWQNDRQHTLLSQRDKLKKVLFQEKLGSVYDKSERLMQLSAFIAAETGADEALCQQAAELCKCDLLTDIVNELPKMQGIAGRYYATFENYPDAVCLALEQHYWPKQAGGAIPAGDVGRVLAIAEKVDTLTGIFGIGLKPTGARDPFALRRNSLGLLRILIEAKIDIDLAALIEQSARSFGGNVGNDFQADLIAYILERLKGYYQEKNESPDVVDAVLAKGLSNPFDISRRIDAVSEFRQTDAAEALAAANKRIRNMLKKVEVVLPEQIDRSLLDEPAEQRLADDLAEVAREIEPHYVSGGYSDAMSVTARLRESVDGFFDDVMVMTEDQARQLNRLALLKQVGELCSRTADLSRLQPEARS